MTAKEALDRIIDKCDLLIDGQIISKELLMRTYAEFLSSVTEKEKHNVGFVLHTGSVCFDAIALAYALATCLVYNEYQTDDVIASLQEGDTVLYGDKKKERYIFNGYTNLPSAPDITYVLLSQGGGNKTFVPQKRWGYIQPYFGASKRFDGRGLRKKSTIREDFYNEVLEYKTEDIPSVLNVSVVLVLPREQANYLIDHVSLRFNDKEAKLLDLVTASYFSENDDYPYGGNTAKTEPILKIAGKISVARQLVISKRGNKHIGIMVFGNETVSRSFSELPELLNRQSLRYIYVLMNMDCEYALPLIREVSAPNVFLCSKDFLLSNSLPPKAENKYVEELARQVSAVIDRNIEPYTVNGWFSWDDYKAFKKAIFSIRNSDYIADEKEDFIITACYLINIFLTSVFKITELERCITAGILKIPSIEQRIDDLNAAIGSFPKALQEKAQSVVSFLESSYLFLMDNSEKENYLRAVLAENKDKHIAVVVPKSYYATVMRESGYFDIMDDERLLTVVNANSFDNTLLYDRIIITGNFNGKRFDSFRCMSSPRIETLLYDFESNIYRYRMKNARKEIAELNSMNTAATIADDESIIDELYYSDNASETDIIEISEIDANVDEYINQLNEIASFRGVESFGSQQGSPNADVIAVGTFDSGEKVFFTKFYKAYVFDESDGVVKEINASELNEGDTLVFTQNTAETRDIVDSVLARLINEHKVNDNIVDCYGMSKRWKQALQKHMRDNNIPASEIAKEMIKNGVSVQEITIRGWLDEDSHTVGPRKQESIEQIALLIEDEDMLEHADQYFEACGTIRRIRREILGWIGEAIIDKLSGRAPLPGTVNADIYDRIDSVAQILRLETISFVNRSVPMNMTNRPISL